VDQDVAQLEHAVIVQFSGVAQSRYLNMRLINQSIKFIKQKDHKATYIASNNNS